MILSRIWYIVLALVAAFSIYAVSLAVGQYNRRTMEALTDGLRGDSQIINWQLQIDSRRRLDSLILATGEKGLVESLRTSAGSKESVPAKAKEDALKVLKGYTEKLPADYKTDIVFAVDREGRLVAQVGYDTVAAYPTFELGGYPAVFDALHGFLRDDVWSWNGQLYRVVARPVEDEPGQPAIGAVVSLRKLDAVFARELAKRTRTNVAFFSQGQRQSQGSFSDSKDEIDILDLASTELAKVAEDKSFKESGRTEVRTLGDKQRGGVMFTRLIGEASEVNAGFVVARTRAVIDSPFAFMQNADASDRSSVPWALIVLVALGGAILGLLFSVVEHTLPIRGLRAQADALQKGGADLLSPAQLRGAFRQVGQAINEGIARVVEKGGGQAKRPANLEAILGPTDQPAQMSAFALPQQGFGAERITGSGPRPPLPPPNAQRTTGSNAAPYPAPPPPPPTPYGAPIPSGELAAVTPNVGTPHIGGFPSPGSGLRNAPPAMNAPPVGYGHAPPAPTPFGIEPPTRPTGQALQGQLASRAAIREEDDATVVGQPPAGLLEATANSELEEWRQVYEEFVKVKRQCNERVDNLTFEKFQLTLKKNRDVLMEQHKCKAVKFTVYVKDGKASLKATPAR